MSILINSPAVKVRVESSPLLLNLLLLLLSIFGPGKGPKALGTLFWLLWFLFLSDIQFPKVLSIQNRL